MFHTLINHHNLLNIIEMFEWEHTKSKIHFILSIKTSIYFKQKWQIHLKFEYLIPNINLRTLIITLFPFQLKFTILKWIFIRL